MIQPIIAQVKLPSSTFINHYDSNSIIGTCHPKFEPHYCYRHLSLLPCFLRSNYLGLACGISLLPLYTLIKSLKPSYPLLTMTNHELYECHSTPTSLESGRSEWVLCQSGWSTLCSGSVVPISQWQSMDRIPMPQRSCWRRRAKGRKSRNLYDNNINNNEIHITLSIYQQRKSHHKHT